MVDESAGRSATATVVFPEAPGFLRADKASLGMALRVFGPGAIIASATIGSGETVFASRGGAVFGYAILWMFVVGGALKAALAYSQNRYITLTGEHPMTRWATLFPGPRGWFPLLLGALSILSFPSWAGGVSAGLGDHMAEVTFGSGQVWATFLIVLAAALAWVGGYEWLERAQIAIVAAMLIALVVGTAVARPDWLAALAGLLPQWPAYADWVRDQYPAVAERSIWVEVVTYIGAIGGGTYDYIGYTGMMREKRWGLLGHAEIDDLSERFLELPAGAPIPLDTSESQVARARTWLRAPLGDVMVSFVAITIFTVLFVVNGANILHADQLIPTENEVLTHQKEFFTVIAPALQYLYDVAVFFALFGTVYGVWEVYSYTTYETLGAVSRRIRHAGQRTVRRWVYPYVLVAGLVLIWTVGELVAIVTPASLIGGVLTCGIFCLAILWTERRMLPAPYRMRGLAFWWVLVSGVVLTVFGVISVGDYVAGLFG